MSTGNSDGDYVKLKMRRDLTSSTLVIYEFRMSLFDHDDPEKFLLLFCNLNMTLAATVTLEMNVGVQYLSTLVCG